MIDTLLFDDPKLVFVSLGTKNIILEYIVPDWAPSEVSSFLSRTFDTTQYSFSFDGFSRLTVTILYQHFFSSILLNDFHVKTSGRGHVTFERDSSTKTETSSY